MKKAAFQPTVEPHDVNALLAEMPSAVFAAEPATGRADKTVLPGIGVGADRCGSDSCRGADRAADDAGGDIGRPEAAVAVAVPAVVAVVPLAVMPVGGPLVIGASVGIARPVILAIGVRIVLRAFAGLADHLLGQSRACQHRGEDGGGAENFEFCHAGSPKWWTEERMAPAEVPISGLCALQTGVKFQLSHSGDQW